MRLAFILGEIGSGLRRNLSMVISVILVTFISLTFVGASALLQLQINQIKGYWYDKVEVSVNLCATSSTAETCAGGPTTDQRREELRAMFEEPALAGYIKSVQYESQDDALKRFKEQFANSPIVDFVTADQLSPSFKVALNDPTKFPIIQEAFVSQPGVDSVFDQKVLFEKIFAFMNGASLVSLGIAGVMIFCAILLIATTIRLSAFSRRRETGIMRLVGASRAVIQLPFVLEGVIAAAIGGLLASITLWVVMKFYVNGPLSRDILDIPFIPADNMYWLGPLLILLAGVLAGFSSILTLRRYLKV